MTNSTVVTAVGVAVNTVFGEEARRRLEAAMVDAIQQALRDGVSIEEANSSVLRERMQAAHARVLAEITRGA